LTKLNTLAACFPSPPLFLYDDTDSHTVRVQRSLVSSLLVVWGLSLAYLRASKKKGSEKIALRMPCTGISTFQDLLAQIPANPLPATTSTATTRTPQPHLPLSTVAMAALHNNRGDPHLAGNELCSMCHIKTTIFPRSQDGRILVVLPHPTTLFSVRLHSTRFHRSTAGMTSATPQPYQHTEEIGPTALLQTLIVSEVL
jgi:hypothetical protein